MTIGMLEDTETQIKSISKRRLYEKNGNLNQPLLVFVCGIHGNEPMSLKAMLSVAEKIESQNISVRGSVLGISGNIKALELGERFIDRDLNRMWTESTVLEVENSERNVNEKEEMSEIWSILKGKIDTIGKREFVVYDLHTTSSPSVPFITINDTISNRNIAKSYPLASVFGIEEYLNGPLLSYMNELGYNAIGFEGGQHDDIESFYNHEAFIWLSLANHAVISRDLEIVKRAHERLLKASADPYKFFEITYRYLVKPNDRFKMQAGYNNFQSIDKDIKLADNNDEEIISKWDDRIFMPLYQDQGDDGFFIIRRIPVFFLWLSRVLRKYNFEKLLLVMPGVSMYDKKRHVLKVKNKMIPFLRNEVFHLLGFRQKVEHDEESTLYIRREKQ